MTRKEIEFWVDVFKSIGLASLIGSVADSFIDGTRIYKDILGALFGIATLYGASRLTKRLNGDKL